ncbi:MAG TPA: hypothetical protein EYP53_07630 [Candidatus Latescibacteria bacterium]|nr:hypothetical protein [Candidatus Latescibacterota bacterium]
MRRFGLIYIVVLLGVSLVYYLGLPHQTVFLKERRWVGDENAILVRLGTQIPLIYDVESESLKVEVSTRAGTEIAARSKVLPIATKEELLDYLSKFKAALRNSTSHPEPTESLFESIEEKFTEEKTQYTAAFTTTNLTLIEKELVRVSPFLPPLVTNRGERKVIAHALFLYEDGGWTLKMMAEEREDGSWVVPEKALSRYIGL